MDKISMTVKSTANRFTAIMSNEEGVAVSYCTVSMSDGNASISAWFTNEHYQNKGIGTKVFKTAVSEGLKHLAPDGDVIYVWNGAHPYVLEWLQRHFHATSMCSISVLKYSPEDTKLGHQYKLDTELVRQYVNEV